MAVVSALCLDISPFLDQHLYDPVVAFGTGSFESLAVLSTSSREISPLLDQYLYDVLVTFSADSLDSIAVVSALCIDISPHWSSISTICSWPLAQAAWRACLYFAPWAPTLALCLSSFSTIASSPDEIKSGGRNQNQIRNQTAMAM
jgi:hypothetical protein